MTKDTEPTKIRACGTCGKHRIAKDRHCSRCGLMGASRLTEWQARVLEREYLRHIALQDLEKVRVASLTPEEREQEDQQMREDINQLF
jgi:hypothetical protein